MKDRSVEGHAPGFGFVDVCFVQHSWSCANALLVLTYECVTYVVDQASSTMKSCVRLQKKLANKIFFLNFQFCSDSPRICRLLISTH
jgi:hypothetical protein